MPLNSSPRPKARPSNTVKSSPRPQARPTKNVTSSPRPKARPSGGFFSGNTEGGSLTSSGSNSTRDRSPAVQTPGPDTTRPKPRPTVAPDNSLLLNKMGAKRNSGGGSFRGAVLSNLYRLPADGTRAVRALQSFNGPTGKRTVLGQ